MRGPSLLLPMFVPGNAYGERVFRFCERDRPDSLLLCFPDHVVHCVGPHSFHKVCEICEIPVCRLFLSHFRPTGLCGLPMAISTPRCGATRRMF